ncbi:MAG: hypothetical protein K2X47_15305 [Bdellovibrionales bacterium]|nr:hypothetical protein [Bdellovibrionales bacterium]
MKKNTVIASALIAGLVSGGTVALKLAQAEDSGKPAAEKHSCKGEKDKNSCKGDMKKDKNSCKNGCNGEKAKEEKKK